MERRKQTGQICRWMALGITIATIVVGCTIVVGLFEWCDRSWMESLYRCTEIEWIERLGT